MSFRAYRAYTRSGIVGLDDVPTHWSLVPLRYCASLKGRLGWQGLRADEYTDEGPFLVTSEHLENDRVQWDRCHHVTEERYQLAPEIQLRPHDLLMMKDGAAMGKLGYVHELPGPACLNSHLLLFRPTNGKFLSRFLYYVLRGPQFEAHMATERKGTTFFGISQESIGRFPIALPPIVEQAAIVDFLDRETTHIDALISEQQRLIELLQEKRQAVISHAVTKGLDPTAPMKDSGAEWLGRVPAHWSVLQSRRLFRVRSERALVTDQQLTASQKYGILLQSDFVAMEGRRVVETIKGVENLLHVEPDDFVISMRSFQGGIEWSRERGSISFHYVMLVPIKHVWPPFFAHLFKSMSYIQALRSTTDLIRDGQEIRFSHFAKVPLPVVPLDEQRAIAAHLDRELAAMDALITEAERAIALLNERRAALISAAVTGKIDVRSAAQEQVAELLG